MSGPSAVVTGVGVIGPGVRDQADVVDDRALRHAGPETAWLVGAARTALAEAQAEVSGPHLGIAVATRTAGHDAFAALHRRGQENAGRVPPALGPHVGPNAPASQLAIVLDARGPNLTVTAGAASFLAALDLAVAALNDDSATTVLVAAVESPVAGCPVGPEPGATVLVVEGVAAAAARGAPDAVAVTGPWLGTFSPTRVDAGVAWCCTAVERMVADTTHGVAVITGDVPELVARVSAATDEVVAGGGWRVVRDHPDPAALAARIQALTRPEAPVELVIRVGSDGRMSAVMLTPQPGGFR